MGEPIGKVTYTVRDRTTTSISKGADLCDLYSRIYLTHEQDLFLKALARWLRLMLSWYASVDPTGAEHIRNTIDCLEGWVSMTAGEGMITITAIGIGEVNSAVVDGEFWIAVLPHLPLDTTVPEPLPIFVTSEGAVITRDLRGMAFARRILRYVDMQHQRYNKAYQFETRWTSKSKLRPSAYWIALRDAAIESGTPHRGPCTG